MSPHRTITRTHRGGPDVVVHTEPDQLLEIAEPWEREPHWTDPVPARGARSIHNPWSVRLLGVAVLAVLAATVAVLSW